MLIHIIVKGIKYTAYALNATIYKFICMDCGSEELLKIIPVATNFNLIVKAHEYFICVYTSRTTHYNCSQCTCKYTTCT